MKGKKCPHPASCTNYTHTSHTTVISCRIWDIIHKYEHTPFYIILPIYLLPKNTNQNQRKQGKGFTQLNRRKKKKKANAHLPRTKEKKSLFLPVSPITLKTGHADYGLTIS